MALLFPTLEYILELKVKPTEGELALLNFLNENLDDNYEVYFQPFINGDMPDIVIMRKNSGVLIIEVKDWNLQHYRVEKVYNYENDVKIEIDTKWFLKNENIELLSPIQQVKNYKDNLYNLHIEGFLESKFRDNKNYAIVSCAVYFNNIEMKIIENEIKVNTINQKGNQYFEFIGKDSLNNQFINKILDKLWMNKFSNYFDDELYFKFKRFLLPPFHSKENGKEIIYTTEQKKLIESTAGGNGGGRQKIKGVAGSGKTQVLAKRAVNSHKRTKSRVLILTFNISLCNYIHDKVSEVKEDFNWSAFYICNYHLFFNAQSVNLGIKPTDLNDYEDVNYFENVKHKIIKYDAIFIDEVQDYEQEWLDIITKYFLKDDAEFVVFGDEKQNIYLRELDNNKDIIIRKIRGDWNKTLNSSMRFTSQIAKLAMNFQKEFFQSKYNLDSITVNNKREIEYENKYIKYYYSIDTLENNIVAMKIIEIISKYGIHSSDVAIVSSKVEYLRDIDWIYRQISKEKTSTMFESKETYNTLKNQKKNIKEEIKKIRRNKKFNFWMNSGLIKFCTIQSFKGWEIHSLILLINNEDINNEFETSELIYTGLTRARMNIFIFNIGNKKYHKFCSQNIDEQYEI